MVDSFKRRSLARASYWQGRAAEALGKTNDARAHYTEKVPNRLEDLTDDELEQLDRLLATACQAEEPPQ
jgi:hypothetical protein